MGENSKSKSAAACQETAAPAASTAAPPARKEGSQENSDGTGLGGTDDTAENDDEEEVYPKVSKVKMTPRGGRHEPYEKEGELTFCFVCFSLLFPPSSSMCCISFRSISLFLFVSCAFSIVTHTRSSQANLHNQDSRRGRHQTSIRRKSLLVGIMA